MLKPVTNDLTALSNLSNLGMSFRKKSIQLRIDQNSCWRGGPEIQNSRLLGNSLAFPPTLAAPPVGSGGHHK
jgi:hypothetical protein